PLDYMTIVYQGVTHSYQEINTNYAYITKEIGEVFDVTSFKNKLMAYDNTDGEISENIYIAYDYYTPNYNKCGLWEIMFRVSDNMENETEFSLFVYNKDNVAPVIVGPSLIQTTKDTLLTETEILSNFSAYDEIDLDVSDRIIIKESTYFINHNKVGKWPIFLEVSDSSENIKTFVCYIEVLDNEAPIFVVDPLTVNINLAVEMPTIDVIINNLKFENQISSNALIEIIYDEYTSSNAKTGDYIVRLLVDNEIKDIKIVVNETTNEESESVIKKVLNAIKNFFVGIFNLFKNLWEKIF
ncbi:MAG: hypothetical protein PHT83_04630, partial [Bacilli bacterium]|nr:hypothetical protein [Bacilli bacterium]